MAFEKDKISRKAFANPDVEFLNKLLSMKVIKTRQLPPRVRQTIEERETDIILGLYAEELLKEFVLHLEFQSSNDNKMIVRMAIYDYIIYEESGLEVMGIVIYMGKAPLSMENNISFFNASYSCPIIDIRNLDPQLFINSNNPRQVIYGMLAGPDSEDKQEIIQKILSKLQQLLFDSEIELKECLSEMEFLAHARSQYVQNLIKKKISHMPITLSIKDSVIWKDELDELKEEVSIETAKRMIEDDMPLKLISKYTSLSIKILKELKQKLQAK